MLGLSARSAQCRGLVLHLKKVSSLPLNAKHCHVGVRREKHSLNISALVQNLTLKSHIRVTHTTLGSLGMGSTLGRSLSSQSALLN